MEYCVLCKKNINREDAILFIDRLNNSDTKDYVSDNIVWGIIWLIGDEQENLNKEKQNQ